MVLDAPRKGEGIQTENRGDSETVVDWINGKARQGSTEETVWKVQRELQNGGARPSI